MADVQRISYEHASTYEDKEEGATPVINHSTDFEYDEAKDGVVYYELNCRFGFVGQRVLPEVKTELRTACTFAKYRTIRVEIFVSGYSSPFRV